MAQGLVRTAGRARGKGGGGKRARGGAYEYVATVVGMEIKTLGPKRRRRRRGGAASTSQVERSGSRGGGERKSVDDATRLELRPSPPVPVRHTPYIDAGLRKY